MVYAGAGCAQPASSVFADRVGKRGGQELKCAEDNQVQRHELFDSGQGVGRTIRPRGNRCGLCSSGGTA